MCKKPETGVNFHYSEMSVQVWVCVMTRPGELTGHLFGSEKVQFISLKDSIQALKMDIVWPLAMIYVLLFMRSLEDLGII